MRMIGLVLLVLVLRAGVGPASVQAQTTVPGAPAQAAAGSEALPLARMLDAFAPCPLALPDWATPSERFAWNRVCTGQVADMRLVQGADDGKGCKAVDKAEVWPAERKLTARFIKLITTRRPYIDLPAQNSVAISCAEVTGTIELYQEVVPLTLNMQSSRLPGGVNMVDAHFGRDLIFDGSDFGGQSFWAEGLHVADDLFVRNAAMGYLKLTGADVGGNVELSGSVVRGQYESASPYALRGFQADSIRIGGHLIVNNQAGLDGVLLVAARIGGDVSFSGAIISGVMRADSLSIGGSLFLTPGTQMFELSMIGASVGLDIDARGLRLLKPAPPDPAPAADAPAIADYPLSGSLVADRIAVGSTLFLNGASIDGTLALQEGRFGRVVEMDGIRVGQAFKAGGASFASGLWPRGSAEIANLDLKGAEVDGSLQLQGTRITGSADFAGARIGELWLSDGGTDIRWGPLASINLNNADVGVLQSRMPESWRREGDTRLPARLENFRYDRLTGGAPDSAEGSRPKIDSASLIDWVRNAVTGDAKANEAGFVPQPFRQLEETLRSMGAEDEANAVLVAGHQVLMETYTQRLGGWLNWIGDAVWWALVGFGAHPFRVLWWFAALVGAGILVARRNRQLRARGWTDCFWFSLENALPLVQPSAEHATIAHESETARNFFHFQKVAGFVLATILVGALTVLGG